MSIDPYKTQCSTFLGSIDVAPVESNNGFFRDEVTAKFYNRKYGIFEKAVISSFHNFMTQGDSRCIYLPERLIK
ncbi:hypothetical protein Mapa_014550 [Marchantia paleacea]|nr:hypothetical protein Mapa_014550 [Marchantia paleacea]